MILFIKLEKSINLIIPNETAYTTTTIIEYFWLQNKFAT